MMDEAAIRADERRKTADHIASELVAWADDEALRPNRDSHSETLETWLRDAARLAHRHRINPPHPDTDLHADP